MTTDRYLTYKMWNPSSYWHYYILVLTEAISESFYDHKSRSTMYILLFYVTTIYVCEQCGPFNFNSVRISSRQTGITCDGVNILVSVKVILVSFLLAALPGIFLPEIIGRS